MNIDEQVELLMQGTEYGDEELKKAMTAELRQRLLDAQKEGRPLRVYCGYDPHVNRFAFGTYDHHAEAAPISRSGTRSDFSDRKLHGIGR